MNLYKRTSPKNSKLVAQMEMAMLRDARALLLENSQISPEETPPICPQKLHAYLVLASYETLCNKEKSINQITNNIDLN